MHKTIAQSRRQMFGPRKFVLIAIVVVGTLFSISATAGSPISRRPVGADARFDALLSAA